MISAPAHPLIVTARMDANAQATFDSLREAHFPPERNHLKAHITMFHALPCALYSEIMRILEEKSRQAAASLQARTICVRSLGRGVAFDVECPLLVALRSELRLALLAAGMDLTPQDSQVAFRPHITVQNKVEPEAARLLYQTLSASFHPSAIEITALSLWEYRGGPWDHLRDFMLGTTRL